MKRKEKWSDKVCHCVFTKVPLENRNCISFHISKGVIFLTRNMNIKNENHNHMAIDD